MAILFCVFLDTKFLIDLCDSLVLISRVQIDMMDEKTQKMCNVQHAWQESASFEREDSDNKIVSEQCDVDGFVVQWFCSPNIKVP